MVGEGSDDPELTIRVFGAEPSEGRIHLAVFASRSDYLKVPLKDLNRSVDEKGEAVFVLTLPKGQYSACAFYDKNENGKLDKGFFGDSQGTGCFFQSSQRFVRTTLLQGDSF